jgi:HlyD family secretion protein
MRKFVLLLVLCLLSACKEKGPHYNGYFDADFTYLSSDFAGRLSHLFVKRGEPVPKEKLLFKLEHTSENYGIQISQLSKKNLAFQKQQLIDQLHYAEINYRRTLKIKTQDAASQNDVDVATKDLDVLRAQLAAINVQINSSQIDVANRQWQIRRKKNTAPEAGIIFDTYFTEAEYVQAGQPIVSLITPKNIKVLFFVPEEALGTIKLNQTVQIESDANPHLAQGKISYIANVAQYTPPIIYSREQRQKLVFRVEARIDSPNLALIHLGQPVTIELVP